MSKKREWGKVVGQRLIEAAIEWSFVVCRIYVTGIAALVFLAMPPVVQLTQALSQRFVPLIPLSLSDSTILASTREALQIVWLGQQSSTLFTPAEYRHLLDVHNVFAWCLVTGAVAVTWSILIEQRVVKYWLAGIYRRVALGVLGLLLVEVMSFSFSFELFHRLFFPQGNYLFAADSYLIQSFSPSFWLVNVIVLHLGVAGCLLLQAQSAQRFQQDFRQ